jgi:prolyl-tRNA synthetase
VKKKSLFKLQKNSNKIVNKVINQMNSQMKFLWKENQQLFHPSVIILNKNNKATNNWKLLLHNTQKKDQDLLQKRWSNTCARNRQKINNSIINYSIIGVIRLIINITLLRWKPILCWKIFLKRVLIYYK